MVRNYSSDDGNMMSTLNLKNVTVEDYGYYVCESELGDILKEFYLYINSSKYLIYPPDTVPIRINSGCSAIGKQSLKKIVKKILTCQKSRFCLHKSFIVFLLVNCGTYLNASFNRNLFSRN